MLLEEWIEVKDLVEDLNYDNLRELLKEFEAKPSSKHVSNVMLNYIIQHLEFSAAVKVRLSLTVYGKISLVLSRPHYFYGVQYKDPLLTNTFRNFLEIVDKYVEIPFDRIPLLLPLSPGMDHYDTVQDLIKYRLEVGV